MRFRERRTWRPMRRGAWAVMGSVLVLATATYGEETRSMAENQHEPGRWLSKPSAGAFAATEQLTLSPDGRELTAQVFGEVSFDISLDGARAEDYPFVYLLFDLPSPAQIEVFYQPSSADAFDNAHFALGSRPTYEPGPRAYRIDMRSMPGWSSALKALRVRLGGLMPGTVVAYGGIAASSETLDTLPDAPDWLVVPIAAGPPYKGERFAACSRTVVSMDEVTAAAGLSTYIENPKDANPYGLNFDPQSQLALAQFRAGIDQPADAPAPSVTVTPGPGTLKAALEYPKTTLRVQAAPLRPLSDTAEAEGAVLCRVRAEDGEAVWVDCGKMAPMTVWERGTWLRTGAVPGEDPCTVTIERGGEAVLRHPGVPYVVVLRPGPGAASLAPTDNGDTVRARFPKGEGWILAAFAPDEARARTLARRDPVPLEAASFEYFKNLLDRFHIKTPSPTLDEAFRAAWLTMDYTWVKPYGCMESLHHWWALWQQYPSASFDWAGLADRSRESILEHARRQYKSGSIPYLLFFGERHSDFGGNNQTFMWQVKHYLETTGDTELAREILPVMRRLTDAFWRYEDLDDDGIPSFGVQVLTQEDYVASPRDTVSSAVVGVEMWRTLALTERLAGNTAEAAACHRRAAETALCWRDRLWMPSLGRPAYFVDDLGGLRLEGPYHTFALPVAYGLLDPLDTYTTVRHLRDRLIGPNGELYYCNLFPNHISGVRSSPYGPTWGMQAGAYMQPWAARAFSNLGDTNEAIRSLEAVAQWATMFPHLGAWPESSTEFTPAYFSNTAANYAQAIIETLFGLHLDRSEGILHVQPTFPDAWDHAAIHLGPAEARFTHTDDTFEYVITTGEPLRRVIRWPVPAGQVALVTVNGQAVAFHLEPRVGGFWLCVDTDAERETALRFEQTAADWYVEHPGSLAEGESMDLRVTGCRLLGIEDPCGVTRGSTVVDDGVRVQLANGLLNDAQRFGRLGQLNFSRRTFFLRCGVGEGPAFWAPVDFALLPRVEAAPEADLAPSGDGWVANVTLRNNTGTPLRGAGLARWAGGEVPLTIDVPSRDEQDVAIGVPDVAFLTPGENPMTLVLPTGESMTLHCPAVAPFRSEAAADSHRFVPVTIGDDLLISDEHWMDFAAFPVFWQGPYNSLPRPMDALRGQASVACARVPRVTFPLDKTGRVAVASRKAGHPVITVPVNATFRKLYLLVLPFVENHDTFSQCGLVQVTCRADYDRPPFDDNDEPVQWTRARYDKLVIQRPLYTPGDLDSWMPEAHVGPMATARQARRNPYGLLSQLTADQGDWPEGTPLASPYGMHAMFQPPPRDGFPEGTFRSFPQPQFWVRCPEIRTESAVFNVVEIDLGRPRHVETVEVTCPLQDAALGLVSIVGIEAVNNE